MIYKNIGNFRVFGGNNVQKMVMREPYLRFEFGKNNSISS